MEYVMSSMATGFTRCDMSLINPQIVAAIFGAAMAFFLMRLGEWLSAWHRRAEQNYRHLLRLEVVYRQYLIDVSGLRVRVTAILERKQPIHAVILSLPMLTEVTLPSSEIQSLDLLNALATHWTLVRKMNLEIVSATNARTLLESEVKSPSTGSINLDELFSAYLETLSKIAPFISELESNTQNVIASILVLARESSPAFTRLFDKRHPRWAGKRFEKKVEKELAVLRQELIQCGKKRQVKIRETENRKI